MSFPSFRAPDAYNPDTLLVASTLVGAIGWNRRDKAEQTLQILEGTGNWQMLLWQFRPDYLRPSIMMAQTSGTNIVIAVFGSTNTGHWLGNVEGALNARPYGGATFANTFFFEMASALYDEMTPLLPQNVGIIRLTGHSMGAAVCNLLANFLMAQNYNVEIIGFAEPRSVSENFIAPHPSNQNHQRIYIGDEQVGWLPMQSLGTYFLFRGTNQHRISNTFRWSHYGWRADYTADGEGRVFSYDRDDVSLIDFPLQNTILFHPIRAYMRAMNLRAEPQSQGQVWEPILLISREIYNQSVDPTNTDLRINVNEILNIPGARAILNIPQDDPQNPDFNLVEWGGFELIGDITSFVVINPNAPQHIYIGANNMAGSTAQLWKVEYLIEDGKYWFTESHVHNESLDFDGIYDAGVAEWEERRKLLGKKSEGSTLGGGSPGCVNIRCSQVLHPKVAFSKKPPSGSILGVYEPLLGSCDKLGDGILTRMHATEPAGSPPGEGVRRLALRAIPDDLTKDGRKASLGLWESIATLWASHLKSNNWGLLIQDPRTPNDKKPVTAFAQDSTTKVWTLDVNATDYQSLDTVRISNTSVPEMNGTYKIVKVSNTQIKLMHGPQTVSSLPQAGECQRVRLKTGAQCKVFAKYDDITFGRECDRDVTLKLKKEVS